MYDICNLLYRSWGCQAHRGLSVGFLLLRYSVLFTVESLSLPNLLFISWLILFRRCWSFLQTKYICIMIHIRTKAEVGAPWNWFKPSSKIFLLAVRRRCFFCVSFVLFLFCLAFVRICLLMACGHLLKGLTSCISFILSNCEVVTFPLVSWVRCGAWLIRFLIFGFFLTLKYFFSVH